MLKNAKLWICIGIIIFYTLFIIICVTQLSVLRENVSKDFQRKFYDVMVFSNLFVNILYAGAALWIPRKKSLQQSFDRSDRRRHYPALLHYYNYPVSAEKPRIT